MTGKVYFVGTPIGNLDDITIRAVNTLNFVDTIACEDTRHSSILLNHLKIKKPTFSYHKFNETECSTKIINLVNSGKNVAVISDAGMPGISDPGFILIKKLIELDIPYEIIPGVTAVTTAVVGAGLGDGKFAFLGFLPPKKVDRDTLIDKYSATCTTLIFFSASHDINKDLDYLYSTLGDMSVVIANELTKKFEKYLRGTLSTLRIDTPRGEYVVLVELLAKSNPLNDLTLQQHLDFYLNSGEKRMDAIKLVARDRNLKKNDVYNQLNK